MDLLTKITFGTNLGLTWTRDALVQAAVRQNHHDSACPIYKQSMKAINFILEDKVASEVGHEDFKRGINAKFRPKYFFSNLKGHFKSDCPQFWDAVADIKHPRHEEALTGVKASKARLMSEAEARSKEKPQGWLRRKWKSW